MLALASLSKSSTSAHYVCQFLQPLERFVRLCSWQWWRRRTEEMGWMAEDEKEEARSVCHKQSFEVLVTEEEYKDFSTYQRAIWLLLQLKPTWWWWRRRRTGWRRWRWRRTRGRGWGRRGRWGWRTYRRRRGSSFSWFPWPKALGLINPMTLIGRRQVCWVQWFTLAYLQNLCRIYCESNQTSQRSQKFRLVATLADLLNWCWRRRPGEEGDIWEQETLDQRLELQLHQSSITSAIVDGQACFGRSLLGGGDGGGGLGGGGEGGGGLEGGGEGGGRLGGGGPKGKWPYHTGPSGESLWTILLGTALEVCDPVRKSIPHALYPMCVGRLNYYGFRFHYGSRFRWKTQLILLGSGVSIATKGGLKIRMSVAALKMKLLRQTWNEIL